MTQAIYQKPRFLSVRSSELEDQRTAKIWSELAENRMIVRPNESVGWTNERFFCSLPALVTKMVHKKIHVHLRAREQKENETHRQWECVASSNWNCISTEMMISVHVFLGHAIYFWLVGFTIVFIHIIYTILYSYTVYRNSLLFSRFLLVYVCVLI